MDIQLLPSGAHAPPNTPFEGQLCRTIENYELELAGHHSTEQRLREALAGDETLLRQKDALIEQQELLSKESDHRLLNNLQMIVSLLSLQSRATANTEAAAQLAIAADRVATIERVHRQLHYLDGVQAVAFKQYLEGLCHEFSTMLCSEQRPKLNIAVEGVEIRLPSATAIPLGFIVNELITNAAKYGNGRITVRLEANAGGSYVLSVSNDGAGLPEGFDPAGRKGLGMRIVRAFVDRIGGELRIGRGDEDQGTRFAIQFS